MTDNIENDPVVGNVSQKCTNAPGHLTFDANFECGNLGRVDELSINEYDLFIRPDTCNPKYRVWFYFSVTNAKENQRVIFNVVNFSKLRTLFDTGSAAPVYKTESEETWSRVLPKNIYYYSSKVHADRFILSFIHVFSSTEKCYFAYCIPYSYTKLQTFLLNVERKNLTYFKRDLLTISVQRRRTDLLTITNMTNLLDKQKMIFITARVHPGETPSSYVMEGLIDFLISDDSQAVELRNKFIFKIVPMLNPDGVYLGNYRCSLMGFDLNRQWQNPSSWGNPTIFATKNLLIQYNNNPRIELCLCIDLHAHSRQTNSFLYGNISSKDPKICEQQLYIPYTLSEITDDYSLNLTQFNNEEEKAGTNRRTLGNILSDTCLCYTLESSFFSYKYKGNQDTKSIPYYESTYKLLGKNIGISILHYSEALEKKRIINIKRSFETFLPKKYVKTFRQVEKSFKNLDIKKA